MELEMVFRAPISLEAKRCLMHLYYLGVEIDVFQFHSEVAHSRDVLWLQDTDNDDYYDEVMARIPNSIKKVAIIASNLRVDLDMFLPEDAAVLAACAPPHPVREEPPDRPESVADSESILFDFGSLTSLTNECNLFSRRNA